MITRNMQACSSHQGADYQDGGVLEMLRCVLFRHTKHAGHVDVYRTLVNI